MANTNPQRIDLWLTLLDDARDSRLVETYQQLLSNEERHRAQRFLREQDRHRYLVTRALVRTVLSRVTDTPAEHLIFRENRYGKPALRAENPDQGRLKFNLSHCHNMVVLALTENRELGVDVENSAIREAPFNIARRYFATEEIKDLDALPVSAQQERFFELWTLKEAYIKARGIGLSLPLDQFGFRFGASDELCMWMHRDLGDTPDNWHRWQIQIASEYLVALFAECRNDASLPQISVTRTIPLAGDSSIEYISLRTPTLTARVYPFSKPGHAGMVA